MDHKCPNFFLGMLGAVGESTLCPKFLGRHTVASPHGPVWCHFGLSWLFYTSKNIQNRAILKHDDSPLAHICFWPYNIGQDTLGRPYSPVRCHFGLNWLCYTSKNIKNVQIWVPNFKIMIFNWSYLPEDYQINSWSSPGHDSACLGIPRSTQRVPIGLTVLFLIEFSNWNWWNRGVSISPIFWCHWVISP